MTPDEKATVELSHRLLFETGGGSGLTDEDWTLEEHNSLWNEFYPPKTFLESEIIYNTCLGHKVREDLIAEAREKRNEANDS